MHRHGITPSYEHYRETFKELKSLEVEKMSDKQSNLTDKEIEVIGNIFDNPELLESEE